MKKLYLFFALMFSVVAAWSQFSLPYAYRFDESTVLTDGWATIYDDPYGLGSYFYGVKEETPQNAGCVFTSPHSWAFANLYSESLPADQYLISPQIQNATADSVQLRFWYRVDGYAISENFRVGYCLANSYSDVYDFTWKSGFESVGNTTWQQYVVNLPSNTQYIIINYRYDDNGVALYLDNILIRADQPGLSYPITVNANAGGTVTPGSTVVPEGNSATFNIAADEGYWIRSVSVDGVPVPAAANQTAYTYIFTDVIASHVLTVEFAIREFAIWVTPDYSHGTVTPDGGVTHQVLVPWGHDTTFYFFPDPGYHVSDVYADGYHGVNMNSYTFTNVRESHNLRVVFSLDAYVINASAGTGGTIYPSGQVPVQGLSDQTFSITPDAGYLIDTLYVDGSPWAGVIPTGYSYTFHSVVANHSIAAVFSHQHYLVRWAAQPQGHVTVTGGTSVGQDSVSVFYEDEVVFQITPDEGYQIADVLVNGVSQGNSSPYTLRQVLSETYVQVLFEPVTFDLLVTVNGRGTVVPMSASHVNYFDTVNVALTPASCAQVDSVLLDGNLLGITDVCEITHLSGPHQLSVYFGYIYYGISIVQSAHGTIQGPAEAICDGSAMYQLLPEDCYRVAHFYVDGIQRDDLLMTINDTVVGRLTHLDADHVVTADFEYQYYTVTVSTSGDGTVSNSGSNSVLCGTDLQMVCIPDECSHVSTLTLNGTDVLSQAERRPSGLDGFGDTVILYLQDVRQNFMVYAGFSVTRDTLTVAAGEGGLVSPSGTVLKNCGENSTLTVTPAACHRIQTVYVDGEDRTSDLVMQGNDAQYTFSNLHANHTFYADFELIPYEMDLSASAGGSIIPQGTTSVNCGEDFSFSVVPSSCHQVDSVWVDGVYMRNAMTSLPNADPNTGDTLTYTFHSVNVSHQIRATFAPIRYSVVAVAMGEGTVAGTEIAGYVNCGSPLHFTFTPDDCNALAHVYYNGFEIFDYEMDEYGVGSYDILSLQGPVMLSASFERYSYEVVSSVVGQGMAMYRPSAIDCSDTVKVSFLAAPCHHLDSVRLNGEWYLPQQLQSSGDTLWYVFQNVRANPEVQAVFSIDSVHFIAAAGSFVSVADSTVACGQAVSPYALIPQCHSITSLQVNQQSYSLSDFMEEWPCSLSGDTLFMEFVMNEDLEIGISYVQDQYVLSVSTDGGTTDWEGTHLVTCGDSIAVHVIADDCYQLASVRVNGTPVVLDSEMTLIINPMEQDMDVVILFERMEFTVSTSSNPYGLIYGTSNSYGCGTSPRFEFVPIDCGILDSVWVDDACVNGSLDTLSGRFFYTFNDLHSNHVLRASFVPRFYEVEVTNPEHVVMDVPSVSMVECDSSYQLYFIADECYSVQSVLLDGEPVPFSESVYLNHLTSDHQLTFVYEQFAYTVSSRWIFEQEMLHEESSIVDCGRDTVLWVNAPDCYTIDSIIINGQQKPILDSFEYQDIHQSVYMNVYLHKNRYSIDLQNTEHWFVSAEWLTSVECGEDAHFQIQLEEGYHIVNLVVDGDTLPPAEEYTFYNMHADHTFSVIVEQDVLVIHTNVYGHGNVFPDSAQVIYGSDTVLRIVPDGCNVIDSVFVDGVYVGNDSIVNFHHVVADATVDVHFAWTHYPVFVQQNGAGQISMPDTNDVPCGDDFELLIRPDDCHQVSQLLWNGSSALDSLQRVGDDFVFRIPNVQEIHWIKVEFIPIVYDVTAAAGNGGLVSVTNAHPLCGQDVQVNFIPDDCYEVDSVWVNGDYVGSMNLCSFTGINENKQVEVTFRLMEDTVNVIANAFGTVSVPNENVLSCGETFSMVLTPDDCYFVDSLWVDGDLKTNDLDTTGGQCRFDLEWVIANHQIQVMFSRIMYPVTVSHLFGGTITPQQMEVPCGEDLDFVVAPWECYQIDSVFVNGVQIPLSDLTFEGANAIVHLTDIRDSVELAAHFSGINYSLDVENHGNGSIFLEQSTVDCDGDVTFYVVPAPCEQVSSVFLNNQEITAGLEHHPNMNPLLGDTVFYTLTNLSDDQLISVYYDVQTEHNVEIVFQSQGEVLLQTQQTVPCGGDLQIPLAWDCYTVDSVFVNGDYVGSLNTFTFENILADQSIVAEFVKNSYTVTAQAGVGGSISPTGEVEVLCGESQTFTATPEEGYYVSGWLVDGETQPASAELTLNDVRGTHTVEAQFAQYTYHVSATNGFGGSVSPADTVVAYGSDVTVAITAEECYV
ncbi:MAG: choice-of-anchor J domain-containing protein, partial [Bacteroidales bacterium]|nr:choice-of-anchor J domain-containing protein [Bacteroidales bacterium]